MTESEFQALADAGYNRIAMVSQAFADLETPLSLYLKLTEGGAARNTFLLESVVGGERFGRYSFIGLAAGTELRVKGGVTRVLRGGVEVERSEQPPLAFIEAFRARHKVALPQGMPRFCGGLAGYFGYDAARYIEPRLQASALRNPRPDPLDLPDILLLQCEELAVIDNLSGRLSFIVYADPTQPDAHARAQSRPRELRELLRASVKAPAMPPAEVTPVEHEFEHADYLRAVVRAKELIAAGDFMQVQVGQRLRKRFEQSPLSLYRALRTLNPSPYMYLYNFGDFQVVGSSPEILVRQEATPEGQKVTIRPLAGTRPRGDTHERDLINERELLADPKERAEHLMLIDLARNDLGRIARTGTVQVTEAFAIERYSHVMHIVSNVEGLLQPGLGALDVMRATFPAGTLSGAPKIRAMEVIDELEPTRRGLYGGAVGYWSFAGDMDLAIAIRTGIVKAGWLYVQAAAGVVADSVPEMEWRETEAKARAVLRAAEQVQQGLDA